MTPGNPYLCLNSYLCLSSLILGLLSSSGCAAEKKILPVSGLKPLEFEVTGYIPLPDQSFTQGLTVTQDSLWLGTGRYEQSRLMELNLQDGASLRSIRMDDDVFGEGITVLGDKVFQLTWENRYAIVYDKQSLKPLGQFRIATEGWGLTHDGQSLILSCGLPILQFIDPVSYRVTRRLEVHRDGIPVGSLNELEFIRGWILSNVWTSNKIILISPESGEVMHFIDCQSIADDARLRRPSVDVLNGIAWIESTNELLVTGKLYDRIYKIKLKNWPPPP